MPTTMSMKRTRPDGDEEYVPKGRKKVQVRTRSPPASPGPEAKPSGTPPALCKAPLKATRRKLNKGRKEGKVERRTRSHKQAETAPRPGIPNEILPIILRYADPSSLSKCMQGSKTFYQVAGPLLYSNIVVKDSQPISNALIGASVIDHEQKATRRRPATTFVNLKTRLLSFVQQLTVATHTCQNDPITLHTFPNLKTLLVIPYADCWFNEDLCQSPKPAECPILLGVRPQKVVIHNSRVNNYHKDDLTYWPMCRRPFVVTCPVLTLILDETGSTMSGLPRRAEYMGLDWDRLQERRLIVCKTPPWLDRIAQRESCPKSVTSSIEDLAAKLLAPLLDRVTVPISIYLFRDLDERSESINTLVSALDEQLADRYQASVEKYWNKGQVFNGIARPTYLVKTLGDYISEGLEDELLWQELQYWRGENNKRLARVEDTELTEIDSLV